MVEGKLLKNLDYTLIFIILAIVTFGIIAIYSASHISAGFGFVTRQLIWVFLSGVAVYFVLSIDYQTLGRYANYLYLANIVVLFLVIFAGQEALGAQRWIDIGPFRFQPSEFAKIILIITFAHFLSNRKGHLKTFWQLIPAFLYVAVPTVLILRQPDLGTSLVFVAILFAMLFLAGANAWLVGGLFTGGIGVAVFWVYAHLNYGLWIPLKDYQIGRLTIFLDPTSDPLGDGYNVIQSLVAVGSGGKLGKGFLEGTQNRLDFLPEQHTDFIFSVIGEEFGFIGAVILLLLFFGFVYRSFKIAVKSKDLFGTLLVGGVVSMIVFQILINIGMTISIMPVTGIPLPLVSYGGSSMLATMIGIGLILNVGIRRQKLMF